MPLSSVSLGLWSDWLLQGLFILSSVSVDLSPILLNNHWLIKIGLIWRILSKTRDPGHLRFGELILPNLAWTRLEVLDDLRALRVDSRLLHPAHMPLYLDIREEILLAVYLYNLANWSWVRLDVVRVVLVLKVALVIRKWLGFSLDCLVCWVLGMEVRVLSFSAPCAQNVSFPLFWLEGAILKLCGLKTLPHLGDLWLSLLVPQHMFFINGRLSGKVSLGLAPPLLFEFLHWLVLRLLNQVIHIDVPMVFGGCLHTLQGL